MSNTRSIAIVGVGGQGTVLTSDILIEGLVDLGFDVKKPSSTTCPSGAAASTAWSSMATPCTPPSSPTARPT